MNSNCFRYIANCSDWMSRRKMAELIEQLGMPLYEAILELRMREETRKNKTFLGLAFCAPLLFPSNYTSNYTTIIISISGQQNEINIQ